VTNTTLALAERGPPGPDDLGAALERLLIAEDVVDPRGLERAKTVAATTNARLDSVITQLGLVTERTLAAAFGRLFDAPVAVPSDYPEAPVLPERLRPKFLRKVRALPLRADDSMLVLAVADPLDAFTRAAVASATGRRVEMRIAVPIELDAAFARLYGDSDGAPPPGASESAEPGLRPDDDAERLRDLASEAPVIRLVNQIIARAVETRASDIHLEPFDGWLRLRYRYDGVLREVENPPAALQTAIISRIKIMAQLDIAERRLPQDGRMKLAVRGQDVDFRVSTLPSIYGESIVIRVLDRSAIELRFERLGLDQDIQRRLSRLLDMPNGIILVTGPTGSGKTTTLYSALTQLNSPTRKIVTVEDPVEYRLAGIEQLQVKPQIGLTFATMLRSILRHDPNVIMVGEIRDVETAQIAVQAALTSHLVLSTLHTNGAASTIMRLRDMGVEDYLLTATINGVLAQRLVRRLCPACKRPAAIGDETAARFHLGRLAAGRPLAAFESVGCAACRDTGFNGRLAIGELLPFSAGLQRLVLAGADQSALHAAAVGEGMRPILDDGLLKVIAGETTLREVLRSVRVED
jgi:general secretion pathway protein E